MVHPEKQSQILNDELLDIDKINQLLDINTKKEVPLYLIAVGKKA